MKPEAPPSSKATFEHGGEVVERHAGGQHRPGTVEHRREPPAAFRRSGVLQLQQVDVELVERPGRLDDRVLAPLARQVLAGQRVDQVLDDRRDAHLAAVVDDLTDGLEALGDQVGLAGARGAGGPRAAGRRTCWRRRPGPAPSARPDRGRGGSAARR